jgi:glycosyltransferase involved in cell wall biosynthesis
MEGTLVLMTGSYPYHRAAEQTFLDPEVPHLARAFDRVVVVPGEVGGRRSELPKGVAVDESLAAEPPFRGKGRIAVAALGSSWVYGEACRRARELKHPAALRRLLAFTVEARAVRDWVGRFRARSGIDTRGSVFYTYWLDHRTMGVVLAKGSDPHPRAVSRAHGYDLYEERQHPAYLPGRARLLSGLDRVFTVSEHGRDYLRRRHPSAADRVRVSRLGTSDPGGLSRPSDDGVFRVVSCSALVPVKRVGLLAEGLAAAAVARPDRRIAWWHFGGGPLEGEVRSLVARIAARNLDFHLDGAVPNAEVLAFYRDRPVDLFANTSKTEGLPVAIMEAASHGIPVLAPAVGGIPELVDESGGVLLSPPVTAPDVAGAVRRLLDDSGLADRRGGIRRRWEERCQAERNFASFARELRALVE